MRRTEGFVVEIVRMEMDSEMGVVVSFDSVIESEVCVPNESNGGVDESVKVDVICESGSDISTSSVVFRGDEGRD